MEITYVALTCLTLGFELCVCMQCAFCCIFGKGLALRGPHGARSVHVAVDNLHKEQNLVFAQFAVGIIFYLLSHVIEMWIYFRPRIALTVSIPLLVFFSAIIYYVQFIMKQLVLTDNRSLSGQIGGLGPYDKIQDLDVAIFRPKEMEQRSGRMVLSKPG